MDKLKTQGGISPELMEQAKQAMLAENMDFSEQQEPSARCGAGMPSTSGFIEQHFDFAQATPDLEYLHKQLKAALKGRDSGRKNSSQARVDGLRAQIKKKLKLDKIAKKDALSMATDLEVYNDPRGGSDSDYAEEGDTQDFQTCQRPDGSYYGSPGRCVKGSEASLPNKSKGGSSKSGGGSSSSSKSSSGAGGGGSASSQLGPAIKKMDAANRQAKKDAKEAERLRGIARTAQAKAGKSPEHAQKANEKLAKYNAAAKKAEKSARAAKKAGDEAVRINKKAGMEAKKRNEAGTKAAEKGRKMFEKEQAAKKAAEDKIKEAEKASKKKWWNPFGGK